MLIYLIAGEPSGDTIGAKLMSALKEQQPDVQFRGVGGDNMQKQGLNSLFDITDLAIMGLVEVIPSIPKVLRRIRETIDDIIKTKPDIVITIDSWSFSARIHKGLKKQHINVLQMHYVAPQVWAWKKGRAKTMHKYIDYLLTLFPNEPIYFTPYGLKTEFVGHPVIENNKTDIMKSDFLKRHRISKDKKIALILPGSRHNEVARLLPVFLETVSELKKNHPELIFVLPTVKTVEKRVRQILQNTNIDMIVASTSKERQEAMQNASIAIAASGTVALELAIADVPHLVAYKVPPLTAWLARHLTNIKYVNLTNILLNKLVVPELLQEKCSKEELLKTVENLLNKNSKIYKNQIVEFENLRKTLGYGKELPSQKAASIVIKLIKERCQN